MGTNPSGDLKTAILCQPSGGAAVIPLREESTHSLPVHWQPVATQPQQLSPNHSHMSVVELTAETGQVAFCMEGGEGGGGGD